MKSSSICDLGYRPFRGSVRFTANRCVPKARASSLAQHRYNRLSRNNSPATGNRISFLVAIRSPGIYFGARGVTMTIGRRELLERCLAFGSLTIAGATSLSAVASAWDDAEKRQPTPWCELGPFYKRQAPRGSMLRGAHDPGMPLAVAGNVYDVNGELLRDATLEIWQTDNAGHYDNEGYLYRAMTQPDQEGGYAFESVIPGHYPQRVCQHVHYLVT